MSPKISKFISKTLHSQTCEEVRNVYNFMKNEAESKKRILDIHQIQEHVAKSTEISHNSVRRIVNEGQHQRQMLKHHSVPQERKTAFLKVVMAFVITGLTTAIQI